MTLLLILLLSATARVCGAAPDLINNLNTDADLGGFKSNNFKLSAVKSLSGGQAGMIDQSLGSGQAYASLPIPAKATQGVLTLWVYNSIHEPELLGGAQNFSFQVNCEGETEGKPGPIPIELFAKLNSDRWQIRLETLGYANSFKGLETRCDTGWTRFDIVNPAGAEPQNFLIYINGREAYRTPQKYRSMESVNFGGRNTNRMFFDDISFRSDPLAFRPSVVQGFKNFAGREPGMQFKPGDKLPIQLELDRRGAKSPTGNIELSLLNGLEASIDKVTLPINWANFQSDTVQMILPSPPRSGYYWLEATYRESGMEHPDVYRGRAQLQYITPGFEQSPNQRQLLTGAWDFVPTVSGLGRTDNPPREIPVPDAPPTDWSKAYKIDGPWLTDRDFIYPFWNSGWYHRKLVVPQSFNGKRIWLDVNDPHTVAYFFVNGKNTGLSLEQPGGTLALSPWLKAGQTADLDIFVVASPYFGMIGSRGPNRVLKQMLGDQFTRSWFLWERGLMGDVTLLATPMGARIESVAVKTSVKSKLLTLNFQLEGLVPGKTYTLDSLVSNAGQTVLSLPKTTVTATSVSQAVMVEAAWNNPILWQMDAPYLYDLNAKLLDATGKSLDVMLPERFGFREVLFDGRFVTVNGIPITLFTDQRLYPKLDTEFGFSTGMRANGYNFFQKDGDDGAYRIKNFTSYDEAGLAHRVDVGRVIGLGNPLINYKGDTEAYWKEVERGRRYLMRKYANHPSIFFWLGPPNVYHEIPYSPQMRDGETVKQLTTPQQRVEEGINQRSLLLFRTLDSSRPIDCRNSMVNDNICNTIYLNFLPIQELSEINSYWVKYGSKPIFVEEDASPFESDWINAAGHSYGGTIPLIAENTARTLGQDAFIRDKVDHEVLDLFEKIASKGLVDAQAIPDPKKRQTAIERWNINYEGAVQALELYRRYDENKRNDMWTARLREYLINWRADAIGSYCGQFMNIGARLDSTLKEVQQPLLAYLAGTPERRTAKNHIFAPGEKLARSILIMNNGRQPEKVRFSWTLTLNGSASAQNEGMAIVPAGGQIRVPIQAVIPDGGDRTGKLTMALYRGEQNQPLCTDSAEIDVLAPRDFQPRGTIAVIDPIGDSVKTLEDMGVKFHRLNFHADLRNYETIVFGRNAFQYEIPQGIDLSALTRAGKNVLILEQSEDILRRRFGFRTEYSSPRTLFIREPQSPLFDGLTDRVMNYWRGSSTLTTGYEESLKELNSTALVKYEHRGIIDNDGTVHRRPPKWGNTHNVGTVVIIKPDTGNFRSLVDCEYALNYAAALELPIGNGRVIFNQLDISNRTERDPAAERYFENLLRYTESNPVPIWKKAVYLGGPRGEATVQSLRVNFTRINAPASASPQNNVLILGEASPETLAGWSAALQNFVNSGGTLFSLPKTEVQLAAKWLPFAVESEARVVNHSVLDGTSEPLLAGLGNSDFYWQGNMNVVAIRDLKVSAFKLNSGILAKVPHGKGQFVLCQAEPSIFDLETRPWLRTTRRNFERTLATLLSNLQVEMPVPTAFLSPVAPARLAATVDLSGRWAILPADGASDAPPPATDKNWQPLNLPGNFQTQLPRLARARGYVWLRRNFEINDTITSSSTVKLIVGQINGADWISINGKQVGLTTINTNPDFVGATSRQYELSAGTLKQGTNEIAILVYFDQNAQLGMSNTNGSVVAPLTIEIYQPASSANGVAPMEKLSLIGTWRGLATKNKEDLPPATDNRWHDVKVPDQYDRPDARQYPTSWNLHDGYFWYKKTFDMPVNLPANAEPFLLIGGVDDEDTTYLNGTLIGRTNKENSLGTGWTGALLRKYAIPRELLKWGQNEITVLNYDPQNDGGIWKAPVEIVFADPQKLEAQRLSSSPYLHLLEEKDDPYRASWY